VGIRFAVSTTRLPDVFVDGFGRKKICSRIFPSLQKKLNRRKIDPKPQEIRSLYTFKHDDLAQLLLHYSLERRAI